MFLSIQLSLNDRVPNVLISHLKNGQRASREFRYFITNIQFQQEVELELGRSYE